MAALREIEALLGHRVPTEVIPGFEPDRTIRPEPIRQRSQGVQGRPVGPRGGSHVAHGRPNLAAGRTDHGRGRPQRDAHRPGSKVGRPAGAPSHPGHGGPRRGPAPVGIGNAPAGVRGRSPATGSPAAGSTARVARSRTAQGLRTTAASTVPIATLRCPASGWHATATADRRALTPARCRDAGRTRADCHTAARTAVVAGERGKRWTLGSCSLRMTRRSAR